jgi:ankyrin repeat protein
MFDFDSKLHTPLMLAVRSGRYQDVKLMTEIGCLDFHFSGRPSAQELANLIGDPEMLVALKEARHRQRRKQWRKE